jgi:hypothetical protein
MDYSADLRGAELRREAEEWRRLHAAAGKRHPSTRERLGRRLIRLGERLIES